MMLFTAISTIIGFIGRHVSLATLHVAGRHGDGRRRLTISDAGSSTSLTSPQSTPSLSELDTTPVYPTPLPSAAQSWRDFFDDRGMLLLLILFLFGVELFFIFWFYGSSILRHVIPRSQKFTTNKNNMVAFTSFKNGKEPRRPETKRVRFHDVGRVKEESNRATRRMPAKPAALVLKHTSPVLKHSSPLRGPPQQAVERENIWMF